MLTRTVSSGPQLAAFELKNWHDLIIIHDNQRIRRQTVSVDENQWLISHHFLRFSEIYP
jgi:hypothetical protein